MTKNKRVYAKIAGKIKKVDFKTSDKPAAHIPNPNTPPPDFQPGQDPIIKFKLDADRDAEIQRKKDMAEGARIFVSWKNRLINRRHTVGQVLEALSELSSELDENIKSEWKNYVINDLINPVIQHFHDMKIVKDFSQSAIVDCPKCEWGGRALFHKPIWEQGNCEMECPECKHRCTQKDGDMITEEDGRRIAEQAKREAK